MRILIVCNRSSGRGRARETAQPMRVALEADGHTVAEAGTGDPGAPGFESVDLVVILGGDGSVHHALPGLVRSRTPLYHCPLGTENLLAREFGADRSVQTLRRAIARWTIERIDLGEARPLGAPSGAGASLFSLMCSFGFDAAVAHRVARARRGAIGRHSYLGPIAAELAAPTLVPLTVEADGAAVAQGATGVLIVANSRQYGARLDPARRADMADGLLDVVFLPARGRLDMIRWAMSLALGRDPAERGAVVSCAKRIEVAAGGGVPCQIDGEASGLGVPMTIEVRPEAVSVLSARGLSA
ncbi:MAG: hypothetical protein KF745_07640 [Phycisphaeraceae bacterium]|nr:hypothetical protein [Phycisphaeraceae bacterium]